jgi:hypothetical protein
MSVAVLELVQITLPVIEITHYQRDYTTSFILISLPPQWCNNIYVHDVYKHVIIGCGSIRGDYDNFNTNKTCLSNIFVYNHKQKHKKAMIKTDGLLRSHPLRTNVAKLTIKGQHKYKQKSNE